MMTEEDVLSQIEGLTMTRLRVCVQETWIAPANADKGHMFDDLDVARLRLIGELTEDLAVNDEAVPIILSLIDQLNVTRRHIQSLDRAIAVQDEEIQMGIAAHLRALSEPPSEG